MRPQDIKIGVSYRFKLNPLYGFAKAIEVLNAGEGVNTHKYKIVKCLMSVVKNNRFAVIRYFRPTDLIKE